MLSWIKSLTKPKQLKLTARFKRLIYMKADGAKLSDQEEREVQSTHYGLLNGKQKDQYKATAQYGFLSECYNPVPDLLLRSENRKEILLDL